MATVEEINQFRSRVSKIRSHTPMYGDLPAGTIKDYSPDKNYDTRLGMQFLQRNPNDPYSWYGKYNFFGEDWDPNAQAMLSQFEFEYDTVTKCLIPHNLAPGNAGINTGRNDWEIREFLIARVLSGNLVTSIEWVDPNDPAKLFRTAYTWPDC